MFSEGKRSYASRATQRHRAADSFLTKSIGREDGAAVKHSELPRDVIRSGTCVPEAISDDCEQAGQGCVRHRVRP
eukprot:10469829-Lingulodinium_polyedra.AAC.1